MNVFKLKGIESENEWGNLSQELSSEEPRFRFSVYDLSECPEDAVIGRSLFDALDLLYAIRFGMMLANRGYDDVNIDWQFDEEDEDDYNWEDEEV